MGHYSSSYEYDDKQKEKTIQERKATMSKRERKDIAIRLISRILDRKAIGLDERLAVEWLVEELERTL